VTEESFLGELCRSRSQYPIRSNPIQSNPIQSNPIDHLSIMVFVCGGDRRRIQEKRRGGEESIVQLSWSWMVLSAHAPERLDGMAPMRRLRGRLSEITLPFESHETPNHV